MLGTALWRGVRRLGEGTPFFLQRVQYLLSLSIKGLAYLPVSISSLWALVLRAVRALQCQQWAASRQGRYVPTSGCFARLPRARAVFLAIVDGPKSAHKGQWREALMLSLICALNKPLSKQSWGWWFEPPWRSLWRHCNDSWQILNELLNSCNSSRWCRWLQFH